MALRKLSPVPSVSKLTAAQCLRKYQQSLIEIWEQRVRNAISIIQAESRPVLRNSIPKFMELLIDSLEGKMPQEFMLSEIARDHALQRTNIPSFTVEQVHAEYTLLRKIVFEILDKEANLTVQERNTILDFLHVGSSSAAKIYVKLAEEREARAIQCLRNSEEEFRALFELAATGKALIEPRTGGFLRVNKRFCELLKYSCEELMKKSLQDIICDYDRQLAHNHCEEVSRIRKNEWAQEKRYRRKDETLIWVLEHGTCLEQLGAHQSRILITVLDISEKKRLEFERAELRKEEFRYRKAAEAALSRLETVLHCTPVGIAFLDQQLRYVQINKQLSDLNELLTGKPQPPESYIGKTVQDMLQDKADQVMPLVRRVIDEKKALRDFEFQIMSCKDSTNVRTVLVNFYPVETSQGEVLGIGAILVDITDRKKAEIALQESLKDFQDITNAVPQLLWWIEEDETIQVNKAFCEYAGWTNIFVRINDIIDLIPMEDHAKFLTAWIKARETRKLFSIEARIRSREGQYRWHLIRGNSVENATKDLMRWYGSCTDIHDQREALLSLERVQAERERLVATLSHDLRTPITAAKMSAELILRSRFGEQGRIISLSTRIVESLSRADRMIHDLLDSIRIQAGQTLPLTLRYCDFTALIQDVLEDLKTIYGERFEFVSSESFLMDCDYEKMRRACMNLGENAIKYGSETAPITFKVHAVENKIRLEVHNEGPIIPEHEQKQLFDLYRRTSEARGSGKKGWGIGLVLVKGIVEAHGGVIEVESKEGKGTTFTIVLPLKKNKN